MAVHMLLFFFQDIYIDIHSYVTMLTINKNKGNYFMFVVGFFSIFSVLS